MQRLVRRLVVGGVDGARARASVVHAFSFSTTSAGGVGEEKAAKKASKKDKDSGEAAVMKEGGGGGEGEEAKKDKKKDVAATGTNQTAKRKQKEAEGSKKQEVEWMNKFIMTSEAAKNYKPDYSEEEKAEHARIAMEYYRKMTELNNKIDKELATKIWLQQEALRSLPDNLRIAAEIIDDTPPPPDRPWPVYATPPIKGFNVRDYIGKKGGGDGEDDDDEEEGGSGASAEELLKSIRE